MKDEAEKKEKIRVALDTLEIIVGGRHELYNLFREERIKLESELIPKAVVRCLN